MEPMTLGSPVSPPAPSVSSPYLPGYLLGDNTPHSPGQPRSPTKTPRQVHFSSNVPTSNLGLVSTPPPVLEYRNRPQNILHNIPIEKVSGPPIVGLFDTLDATTVMSPLSNITSVPIQPPSETNQNDTWVTVFGFPSSAANTVFGHFSQIGHVLQHVYPGQGNWVNLRYSSKIEARKALSYNGRIFGGNVMVGVIPCKDQNILKDLTNTGDTSLSATKSPRSFSRRLNSTPTSPYITSPPSRPRSLVGPNSGDNEVLGAQNVPAKNTSIVSKTMDLFFGW